MNQEDQSNEYPVIWFEPNINSEENKKTLEENKSIILFSEGEKMLEFCKSLNMSFLLIVSNEELLKEFENLKDIYQRRLADFEEETVLTRFLKEIPTERSWRVCLFCTRKDFEDEILTREEVEKAMRPSEVKMTETSIFFREELISWENNPRGPLYQPGMVDGGCEELIEKDHLKCKEWCIRGLKEIVFQRKREKIKMIYYITLAECQRSLNENNEALEHYEKVLAGFQAIYEEIHPSTASSYNHVAVIHYKMRNNQQARDYHMKALDIRKAMYGEVNSFTGDSYNNLGLVLDSLNQSQKAIEFILKASDIYKTVHGEIHSYTATTYANIGYIYYRLKEHKKAIEYHMKALEIRKSMYGELHFSVVNSYINLGGVYKSLREYEKALEHFMKVLSIARSVFGEIHSKTRNAYRNIADVYEKLGELEKSLDFHGKAVSITVCLNGEINLDIARDYLYLAAEYSDLEKWEKSLNFCGKGLIIQRFIQGEDHLATEETYLALGRLYHLLEKQEKELIKDKKSLKLEKFLSGKLARDFRKIMRNENILCANFLKSEKKSEVEAEEKEVSEASNDFPIDSENDENNERIDFLPSPIESDDEEGNSILGKRNAPSEDSENENSEPDVEKKIKQ